MNPKKITKMFGALVKGAKKASTSKYDKRVMDAKKAKTNKMFSEQEIAKAKTIAEGKAKAGKTVAQSPARTILKNEDLVTKRKYKNSEKVR